MVKLTIDQALKKAVEAHNAGAIHDADRIYTTILKVQPKHPVANHNMGLLAVSMNKLEVALPFFKTALEVQPKITNFWLSYISALIALKRFNDAKLIFGQAKEQGLKGDDFDRLERRLSEISYESTEVFLKPTGQTGNILDTLKLDQAINLAQKKAKNGSPEEAQLIYKNILAKFPNNTKAKRGIALLKRHDAQEPKVQEPPQDQLQLLFGLFNQGQLEQALRKSTELLGRFPSSIILHNIRGAIHAGLTQYDMAISFYERALVLNPNNAEVCCNMGHAFRAKGDLGSAMSNYQKTLKLDPKYIEAYASIANIFKHRGELSAAIKNYKLALKINPNQAEICFNLGNALQDNYDLDAAIDAYNQALKIKPNFAVVHYNMGMAFMEKGALEAALDSYKKAIKINPDYAEAYNNMGMALKDQGDLEAAIDSYKVAIRIKPDYVQAHNNVGIAFFDRGDLDNALDSYKHAIKINPDYAEAYNNMGIAFFDRGAFDDALDSYKCAIKINPDYAEAYNNMGTALKDTGDLGAAIDCYKQALKIRPELAEAAINLANFPSALIGYEELRVLAESQKIITENKGDPPSLKFLEGNILLHKGCVGDAFDKFVDANKTKAESIKKQILIEYHKNDKYLKKLKNWIPNQPISSPGALKKLFILGPSRSGKTSLEFLLAKSRKVKSLGEAIKIKEIIRDTNALKNINIDFENIFYRDEATLKLEGFEVVVSTRPSTIEIAIELFSQSTDCYFILVKRDQRAVASEIFTKNYRNGNFYSYEPAAIMDYLNFYYHASMVLQSKVQDRMLDVNFEEIVHHPLEVMRKVSALLSVDFEINNVTSQRRSGPANKGFYDCFRNLTQLE